MLEGAARAGQPVGEDAGVRTVHAGGFGDDTIVEQVRECSRSGGDVVVVTADRALRERVAAAGGSCVGPTWLRERMS